MQGSNGTLVVIDMQREFKASADDFTVTNIENHISNAKLVNRPILLVEYLDSTGEIANHTRTIWRLRKLLRSYPYTATVYKNKDDGSKPVIRTLNKYRYDTDKIFVCGVNICACVRATVKGLAKNYPNSTIEILQNACNCTCFTGKTTCVGSLRSSIGNYRNVCIR